MCRVLNHIELVNGLDGSRFKPLMTRIFERLTVDEDVKIFNSEEEEKLIKLFDIASSDDLDNLIDCLTRLARKVIYNVSKPKSLVPQLMKIGLSEEKAVTFAQVWANCSTEKVNQLKQETFGLSSSLLEDVNWKIKVQCNQNNAANLEKVKTQLDLILSTSNEDTKCKQHSLEFDSDQLKSFYNQLEEIQNQIDSKLLQLPSS